MKIPVIILGLSLGFTIAYGQGEASAHSGNNSSIMEEMKLNLNKDGSHYLKWTFLNQVWLRYNQSNPGTTVLREPTSETFDIGLRRTRIQFYGQLTDHVFFYMQFGQNNLNLLAGQNAANSGNRNLQASVHDARGE